MPVKIAESVIDEYQNDGAVLVKGLLNDREVSDLRKGIEANISNPSINSKIASLLLSRFYARGFWSLVINKLGNSMAIR